MLLILYLLMNQAMKNQNLTKNFSLPTHFSLKVTSMIADGKLGDPDNWSAFVQEVVFLFEGILPKPTPSEYEAISRKIVEKYPCLQDSKCSKYWYVVLNSTLIVASVWESGFADGLYL